MTCHCQTCRDKRLELEQKDYNRVSEEEEWLAMDDEDEEEED